MILLVTGGRDFTDRVVVFAALDRIHAQRGITRIVQGMANGADRLARQWAGLHDVSCPNCYRPRWEDVDHPDAVVRVRPDGTRYDAVAGTMRNQRMLDEERVDGVLAFPGGRGTADMVHRATKAGIPVVHVTHDGRLVNPRVRPER